MSKHNILYIIFPLIITHFTFSRQKKGGLLFEAESPRTSEPSTSATARAAEALVGRFTLHGKKPKCSELSNWLSHIVVRCLCPHSPHSLHSLPLPPLSFILSSNKESPYLFLLFLSLSPLYLIYIYIYICKFLSKCKAQSGMPTTVVKLWSVQFRPLSLAHISCHSLSLSIAVFKLCKRIFTKRKAN